MLFEKKALLRFATNEGKRKETTISKEQLFFPETRPSRIFNIRAKSLKKLPWDTGFSWSGFNRTCREDRRGITSRDRWGHAWTYSGRDWWRSGTRTVQRINRGRGSIGLSCTISIFPRAGENFPSPAHIRNTAIHRLDTAQKLEMNFLILSVKDLSLWLDLKENNWKRRNASFYQRTECQMVHRLHQLGWRFCLSTNDHLSDYSGKRLIPLLDSAWQHTRPLLRI